MTTRGLLLFIFVFTFCSAPARALDFSFNPETATGEIGQTVLLSGQVGATPLMRSFTVYMAYDTNVIDLAEPPVAGTLIAGHQGLQFNYFDHAPFEPNLLEIGATIFGTDFWQGPGELFRVRFALRQCGSEAITAPSAPFFVAADETYPPVTFHPASIFICSNPLPPEGLTIFPNGVSTVRLLWGAVTHNIAGQPLPSPPTYLVYRQQVLPSLLPQALIATIPDTFFIDNHSAGTMYTYRVITQTNP